MPQLLEYQLPVARPPWSVRCIVGFALCLTGMPIGLLLTLIIGSILHIGNGSLIVMPLPLLAGIVLSILGLIQSASQRTPIRGHWFAIAGLLIAIGWIVLVMLITVFIVGTAGQGMT